MDIKTLFPLDFSIVECPAPQGMYFCSEGVKNTHGRALVIEPADLCIAAGNNFEGINKAVA